MKRIPALHVSIYTVVCALAFASACSSGTGDPNGGAGAASGSGTGGGSSSSSSAGGSGGDGGAGGGPSPDSVCYNNVRVLTVDDAFVDDFETDMAFPGWYSFADTDAANFDKIAREGEGAVVTTMAGHVSATGVKAPTDGGFGAGFGFGLKDANGACAGVSAFEGISFWAKGTAGADNALRVQAVHPATQAKADGGDCETNCYNHPGKNITLTSEWKQYTVKWSELAGSVQVKDVILGLSWITPGPDFDIWIDEVTLFSGTAPTGPIGK
ncbi:hypothetical protein [Polyangium jinanense]|uniref:CBM11 domain-containing protein n=1 Tax=Polyangium jinanense TaxID=2829994 RepID=A0A9X3X560_9BACT|nr:hypothetical protein [Polyangium jinanense]MDC3981541.1 hypothetical protein [Polyangium jinanense]